MTFVFLGLFIILLAFVVRSSLGKPRVFLKVMIHILGGIVGLWLINFLLSVFGLEVPINFFTILLVGLLGFPGVMALSVLQLLGI
ncbi:pro-sigmaK processing inhibitor BofA family protein [Desulfosporosinus sp. BICA1-9]|uniref:pro-sigmaK processing inhibitor BofA family protein n=1 Tax=Desulfosporosinus sp. BICA1-9 TaxID=1531958 RepID=UPI00054C46EF|nr:pro-sigmaK processing inhibitor BofA family protein [Desulfosporosinus sp. BICA1-9]KJS48280.1 MAG: sigmaK-factor processing regulatory BofA [Peptococcaceae bacterium BRH_c23]KJS89632.1 MAG: sigmaK-factor processing regulatory BofA [Desulfosporosinus sp. BICA1-9]HBW39173.1 sigmaK-factor processing regulatory BofA [Desulfosporosinus sp.]